MNLTVDRLKELFVKLGGAESVVAGCSTIVEVLNAISAKYDGKDDAILNPDAISNITEIADKIGGGGAPTDALIIKGLTKIVPSHYRNNREITSVEIPGSILEIGRMAFNGCANLTKVTLGEGVQTLDSLAFANTAIDEIKFPESLTTIGTQAFSYIPAEIVEIPGNIQLVDYSAFLWAKMKTLIIHDGVQTIGDSAFEGTLIEAPVILPNSLVSIGAKAFKDVGAEIRCRFSADSPAATNAPWGATGNVIFDYTGA